MSSIMTADEMDAVSRKRKPTPDETKAWENYLRYAYLGSDVPVSVHHKVYDQAYRDGHSSGYAEVEGRYSELAEMAGGILDAIGYDRTGTYGNRS